MDSVMFHQVLNNTGMDSESGSDEMNDIVCSDLQEFITNQLNQMRFNHFLTDMTLFCEDQEFDVHSSIMAASSGFFQELVNKTGQTASIQLPNVKASAISSLLSYIYTGHLEPLNSVFDLQNILQAAKCLQVNDFFQHVSALIQDLLTDDNYLDVWDISDEFENGAIAEEVEAFVASNYIKLYTQPPILKLSPTRMQNICKNVNFAKIPTHIVLKSIISWVDYDKNVRRNFISSLLTHVHENFDIETTVQSSARIAREKKTLYKSPPPRTTLSPPQRDTSPELIPRIVTPKYIPQTDNCRDVINLHLSDSISQPQIACVKQTVTEEIQQSLYSVNISTNKRNNKLQKSPRLTLHQVTSTCASTVETGTSQDSVSVQQNRGNSNTTIKDESTNSGDMVPIPPIKCFSSEATLNTTSPQNLFSSDSVSPNLENSEKLSSMSHKNIDFGLMRFCKPTTSQTSFIQKERVPRLHLTAVNNDNCHKHLRRFASRCKLTGQVKSDEISSRLETTALTSPDESTPDSLSWPCVCPMLQKSDISIIEAVTALSERSSFSPEETEAIMLFNQALRDKLNCIPERETNCLQSMINVPIPVYHPMFYLNRNALEKSAFKPVVKHSVKSARNSRDEVAAKEVGNAKSYHTESSSKPPKRHSKAGTSKKSDVKNSLEYDGYKMAAASLACAKKSQEWISDDSCNSSRETLSGLYTFNQHMNLNCWSKNFDGSPLTEPVVVIFGGQKHGTLLMLNFNLDTHAWRKSEEIEHYFKRNNLELLRNGLSIVYKNQAYIIGGEDKHGVPRSSVVVIEMREEFQPRPVSSMIVPRSGLGGTVFQDFIYVVGGITQGGKILSHAERYGFCSRNWKEIEPLPVAGWAMSLAELGKRLISVGGRKSGECCIGCYSYDPEMNQWTHLLGMPREFECPYSLVTMYGDQVLAFRRSNMSEQGSVAWLDPVHFAWRNIEVSGTPAKRILAVVKHRHKVWILDQSGRLYVYDPLSHTWENAFGFQRSISVPMYAFIVYRALPTKPENYQPE